MRVSGRPAAAAAVAAPMRKLWLLNRVVSTPAVDNRRLIIRDTFRRVRYTPLWKVNNGVAVWPGDDRRYLDMARTGQVDEFVAPTTTDDDRRNWSVLEAAMRMDIRSGRIVTLLRKR